MMKALRPVERGPLTRTGFVTRAFFDGWI